MPESGIKSIVETVGESGFSVLGLISTRAQDERTECRTQRHGIEQRDGNRYRHGQTKLCVERTGRTTHETHWNKDGHEDDRRGHQGGREPTHGIHRSFVGEV